MRPNRTVHNPLPMTPPIPVNYEPDEPIRIPIWTGDEKALERMWEKARGMSDQDLLTTWKCLVDYDPRNYWDKQGRIGMDTWADCVQAVLCQRGLPI